MKAILGGEKAFTDRVRTQTVRRIKVAVLDVRREIRELQARVDVLQQARVDIQAVTTLAGLRKIGERLRYASIDRYVLPDEYYLDHRTICTFCGRKRFGGVGADGWFSCETTLKCRLEADLRLSLAIEKDHLARERKAKRAGFKSWAAYRRAHPPRGRSGRLNSGPRQKRKVHR